MSPATRFATPSCVFAGSTGLACDLAHHHGRPEGLHCEYKRSAVLIQRYTTLPPIYALGCGTIRIYGLGAFQPFGYVFLASSSDTEPAMITSSPCFQLTGVATLCFAVSCSESMTRSTSSKLRPVVIGYTMMSFTFLSGPITKTLRTVILS